MHYQAVIFVFTCAIFTISFAEEKMVLTPNGYMHSSCVHQVHEIGATVHHVARDSMFVTYSNGTRKYIPPCNYKTARSAQQTSGWVRSYRPVQRRSTVNGNCSANPTLTLTRRRTVPSAPQVPENQTLFLFTGLQNLFMKQSAYDWAYILQPVLQWGPSDAGGGSYWSIASWYVGHQTAVFRYSTKSVPQPTNGRSKIMQVNSGDVIIGLMNQERNNSWTVSTIDQTLGLHTSINVITRTPEPWAYVTLEVYNINSCNDYPTGQVEFTNLMVTVGNNMTVTPYFNPQVIPQCEEAMTIRNYNDIVIEF